MFDLVGLGPLWKVMDPVCGDGHVSKMRSGLLAEVGRIHPNGQPNPELEVVATTVKERRIS